MDEDAANDAAGREFTDKNRQSIAGRGESAFAQDCSPYVCPDVEQLRIHGALAKWHEIKAARICDSHGNGGCADHRKSSLQPAYASGPHHDQLAVGIQPIE